jgi:hypothetical protein
MTPLDPLDPLPEPPLDEQEFYDAMAHLGT